jgi:hypothetical protein
VNVRLSVALSKPERMASPRRMELKPSHQWLASRSPPSDLALARPQAETK